MSTTARLDGKTPSGEGDGKEAVREVSTVQRTLASQYEGLSSKPELPF